MNYTVNNDLNNYSEYLNKYNPTESSELLPFVQYQNNQNFEVKPIVKNNNTLLDFNPTSLVGINNPIVNIPDSEPTYNNKVTKKVETPIKTDIKIGKGEIGKAKEMVNFLMNKGLSKQAASGVIGNLMVESGLKTTPFGDKGTSFGLAQWRDPIPGQGRWTNLKNFTTNRGLDINSVNGQMEYLWHELNTSYKPVLDKIKLATTPEQAADIFRYNYERPAVNAKMEEQRRQYARKFHNS